MKNFCRVLTATAAAATIGLSPITAYSQTTPEGELVVPLPPLQQEIKNQLAGWSDTALGEFYEARNFLPVWINADARRAALFDAISTSGVHGLPAAGYGVADLRSATATAITEAERATAELALSQLFVDFARDMNTGMLEPRKLYSANFFRPKVLPADVLLQRAASVSALGDYLESLAPQTDNYAALLAEKVRLQAIISAGDYGASIPSNRLMRPGFQGENVLAVRSRLTALGYGELGNSPIYDDALVQVVETFQTDQRLKPDGVLGPATIGALNASATDRLAQVLVNMERARWVNHDKAARYIRVNIADYTMAVYDNDVPSFRSNVVVGKSHWDHQTPEFADEMTHLIINPTWHVPESIAVNEYLPQLQADPTSLARQGLQVIYQGQVIDPSLYDLSGLNASFFPITIKQPPGRGNALGRVKFMFPNKHNIYLHDTPAKRLFGRERRAYSHGCIRVEKPFELAYHLLAPQTTDAKGTFHSHLNSGRESRINLEVRIPVYLTYNTAFQGDDGEIIYRTDVYGRDKAVLKALKAIGVVPEALAG